MFTKWLKNFRWMNARLEKDFFEWKMANLKVFIAKVCETYRRQHYYKHFAKHACDFSLILLEHCNFLYEFPNMHISSTLYI